ncbi:MAG: hypothetical protein ACI8QF_002854 [Limisphaerales bacterium]|jgi:hypothetical protein
MNERSLESPKLKSNRIVQGLWIGPRLSAMEQLSMASFLRHGHEYHLYVYGDVHGVPDGVRLLDANEILPESSVFEYSEHKSYSGFSNQFRYEMLHRRGGWWVDTDVVCIKPFDFEAPIVLSEESGYDSPIVTTGIIKARKGSRFLRHMIEICREKRNEDLKWGETGPRLLTATVDKFGLHSRAVSHRVFCPFGYKEWRKFIEPNCDLKFPDETHAVHFWNEMWRRAGKDKDGRFPATSIYERLKARYLPRKTSEK